MAKSDIPRSRARERPKPPKWQVRLAMVTVGLLIVLVIFVAVIPKTPDASVATLPQDSTAMIDAFHDLVAPCDAAAQVAQASLGPTGNVREAYATAKHAEAICTQVSMDLMSIKPPAGARGDVKQAFDQALSDCGAAYGSKRSAYGELAKLIDSDQRPSAVAKVTEELEFTRTFAVRCESGLINAVEKAGGEIDHPAEPEVTLIPTKPEHR